MKISPLYFDNFDRQKETQESFSFTFELKTSGGSKQLIYSDVIAPGNKIPRIGEEYSLHDGVNDLPLWCFLLTQFDRECHAVMCLNYIQQYIQRYIDDGRTVLHARNEIWHDIPNFENSTGLDECEIELFDFAYNNIDSSSTVSEVSFKVVISFEGESHIYGMRLSVTPSGVVASNHVGGLYINHGIDQFLCSKNLTQKIREIVATAQDLLDKELGKK